MRRLSRFGIAALVGFSTSFVIALVSYAFGTWLGGHSDNLRDTVYFTVPFALLLGAAAALPPTWQSIGKRRVITAVLVGAILGLLYTFLLFKFVALGFLAIVVQAISCWVAGGISGMLAVAVVKRSRMVSAIVGVCLLAIFVPTPLFNAVTRNQQLTVALNMSTPSGLRETFAWHIYRGKVKENRALQLSWYKARWNNEPCLPSRMAQQ